MTAPGRSIGRLSVDAGAAASFWERVFDTTTGDLRLLRARRLWEAVTSAHRSGALGSGRRVAVIDSGFDMSVSALQSNLHPESVVRADSIGLAGHHGTVVALLVRSVAPEAELLLLDVSSDTGLVADDVAMAIDRAAQVGAHVINLSLEFETDCIPRSTEWIDLDVLTTPAPPVDAYVRQVEAWIAKAEPYEGMRCRSPCPICSSLGAVPSSTLVVAASGNRIDATCPACVARVVGVGFHKTTTIEVEGVVFTTSEPPDTNENLLLPEVALEEPPGFLGTSFAAPLLAGLAVLTTSPADFAEMARLSRAMTPILSLATVHAQLAPDLPEDAPFILHAGLMRFADAIPAEHRHWTQDLVTEPCPCCALLLLDWYNVLTSMLTASGASERAIPIARIAAVLAPDTASAWANLGRACQVAASSDGDRDARRKLLTEAERAYRRAIELDSVTRYVQDLDDVLARLGGA